MDEKGGGCVCLSIRGDKVLLYVNKGYANKKLYPLKK